MDWYSIGVAALSGGIAGGIGAFVASLAANKKHKTIISTVVTVILFAGLMGWAKSTIIADHKGQVALAELESVIQGNPAFESLQEYAPEAMEEVRAYFQKAVVEKHEESVVESNVRQIMASVVGNRLGKASDAAVLNSIRLTVDQMKWLHEHGEDDCFKFLFPHVDGGIRALAVFSEELMSRDYDSTRLILSTYDASRTMPLEEDAMNVLNPIYSDLFQLYGQDNVAQLVNVAADGTDRSQVCLIAIDLYSMVLERSDDEAIDALRWMLK